jgi:hypothetical protein
LLLTALVRSGAAQPGNARLASEHRPNKAALAVVVVVVVIAERSPCRRMGRGWGWPEVEGIDAMGESWCVGGRTGRQKACGMGWGETGCRVDQVH